MNGNYSITANFEQIPTTQYNLSISSSSGGSVTTPGEGTFSRAAGTVVSLVASPASGYRFVNWTGNVGTIANVNSASTTITMNGNYSITANFEVIPPDQYGLSISSSSGGSVTTPGEGTFTRDAGTVVSLVASPASGYRFVNWTGNVGTIANVNSASTTITMNGNYSIKANFEQIEENEVYFPDPNLEAVIREAIAKPTGPIYPSDLAGLTGLHAWNKNITDLTGLDFCTDLEFAELSSNQISDISPLANLTNLELLFLGHNQIVNLSPLANLANLGVLNISSNQISNLSPLANLANLYWLDLAGNRMSDISPLANLTNLTNLYIMCWDISDISPLSNLSKLRDLSLSFNKISNISPLANLTNLEELSITNNQLSDISPLAGLTNLSLLYLQHNQISDIKPLVDNPGLGHGDKVWLGNNPLSERSINEYIPALQARGVDVSY